MIKSFRAKIQGYTYVRSVHLKGYPLARTAFLALGFMGAPFVWTSPTFGRLAGIWTGK